jgi:hypothetical protein
MAIKFSLSPAPLFLIPDIKSLVKFSNGDLGISDQTKLRTIAKNASNSKSDSQLDQLKNLMGFTLTGANSSYYKNGKYQIPTSDINLTQNNDLSGLKALEKSLIQSIFESQKPYAEVFIQTTGVLVKIEDIIARVLSVGGSSLKPFYNPKALGYGGSELNSELSKLQSLKNKQRGHGNTQSGINSNKVKTTDQPNIGYEYKIDSIVYSTGEYDPTVKYNYEYRDILDDTINLSDLSNKGVDVLNQENNQPKPKVVVFGIFNSKGHVVDNVPSWLEKSGKWFGHFDMATNFKYIWSKQNLADKISFGSPGKGWVQKKDITGNPIVVAGTGSELNSIANYYNDQIQRNLDDLNIDKQQQTKIKSQLNQSLNSGTQSIYQTQLDTIISSGFLPTLQLTNGKNPIGKYPFLPKNIVWSGTSSTIGLGLTGSTTQVWIDPENDYDMKLIQIKPQFVIKFYDSKNNLIEGVIDPLSILKHLQKNQVEVIVTGGSKLGHTMVINIEQIDNSKLKVNTPYSKGYYGSSTDGQKQTIETLYRYATALNDTDTYYIVEGILSSENTQSFPVVDNGISVNGSGYYRFPKGPISAIGAFIRMLIDVFSKLFPSISLLENILANPASFIVESVILKKIGDNNGTEGIKFDIFSEDFLKDFNTMISMDPPLRKSFVSNSKLKDYVYVGEDNNYQFLLDGKSMVSFLSANFGINLSNLTPSLITKSLEEQGLSASVPPMPNVPLGGIKLPDTQPILEFLLNLVTFPLNIIKSIIEYIMNFFKKLSNPFELPSAIVEFIGFEWLSKLFNPISLLEILDIKFDVIKFGYWIAAIDTYPDSHLFDLSEIISMPFMPPMFKATKKQLLELEKSPMEFLKAIICLIADIINSFIDFIWSLMGLTPILPPPHVNLCNDINKAIVNNKLQGSFGTQSSIESQLNSKPTQQSYEYLYNITLSDGTILTNLTYDQLQKYLSEHSDIEFDFNF